METEKFVIRSSNSLRRAITAIEAGKTLADYVATSDVFVTFEKAFSHLNLMAGSGSARKEFRSAELLANAGKSGGRSAPFQLADVFEESRVCSKGC